MAERSPFPYLSNEALNLAIRDLKIMRSDLDFRAKRERNIHVIDESHAVGRLYLTALAERTARRALDEKIRTQLAEPPTTAEDIQSVAT